jgi:hypothetical protein
VAIKLLITWDILPGREQEYFEFVVRDFIPAIQALGMEPSDAMNSQEWLNLKQRLLDYVENFDSKVVQARNGFQL